MNIYWEIVFDGSLDVKITSLTGKDKLYKEWCNIMSVERFFFSNTLRNIMQINSRKTTSVV
jgi:hypothetical protein